MANYEYEEINGLPYEKMTRVHEDRQKQIHQLFTKTDSYRLNLYSHTIVFPLYDHFSSKDEVRTFFRDNYDIVIFFDPGVHCRVQNGSRSFFLQPDYAA